MDEASTFESYSYRTGSRFGSRVDVHIHNQLVSISGPRVSVPLYRIWIAVQVLLFWVIPFVIAAAVLVGPIYWLVAAGLFIAHLLVGACGAAGFWELANLIAFGEGRSFEIESFAINKIEDVRIGRGWARNGLWLVIPQYVPPINQMAAREVVSFEAPDSQTGDKAVYALHMRSPKEAQELASLLRG